MTYAATVAGSLSPRARLGIESVSQHSKDATDPAALQQELHIQYLVINYNGKESEKSIRTYNVYILITLLYTRNEHNIVNQLYFIKKKIPIVVACPRCWLGGWTYSGLYTLYIFVKFEFSINYIAFMMGGYLYLTYSWQA